MQLVITIYAQPFCSDQALASGGINKSVLPNAQPLLLAASSATCIKFVEAFITTLIYFYEINIEYNKFTWRE